MAHVHWTFSFPFLYVCVIPLLSNPRNRDREEEERGRWFTRSQIPTWRAWTRRRRGRRSGRCTTCRARRGTRTTTATSHRRCRRRRPSTAPWRAPPTRRTAATRGRRRRAGSPGRSGRRRDGRWEGKETTRAGQSVTWLRKKGIMMSFMEIRVWQEGVRFSWVWLGLSSFLLFFAWSFGELVGLTKLGFLSRFLL